MTWEELSDSWITGANYLWQQAQTLYADKVQADPKAYEPHVTTVIHELETSRQGLDRIKAGLAPRGNRPDDTARFNRMARMHYEMASRFYADTQPAQPQQPKMGIIPVLIVLGLAVGVGATSWAAAYWQHATYLRERVALEEKDLTARDAASREGRTLQPSTLPPPPPEPKPEDGYKSMGKWLLGGLAVVTGILVVPQLLSKPKN